MKQRMPLGVLSLSILWSVPALAQSGMCISQYEPVCGEDGQRYSNACVANRARTSARVGGALIRLAEVNGGNFFFWSENDLFIDEAINIVAGVSRNRLPVFNDLSAEPECSQPQLFHVDSQNMVFADASVEICDATADYIDHNLDQWLEKIDQWCPWSARIVEVRDYRKLHEKIEKRERIRR